MFLNETKPPLEEALVHYGIPGMKWGRRRAQSRASANAEYDEMLEQERHDRNKRRIAVGALVAAGTVATVVILHKTGHVKISPALIAKGKATASKLRPTSPAEERARAKNAFRKVKATGKEYDDAYRDAGQKVYGAYKKSTFAKRTFRPEDVRNPLFSRIPKIKATKLNTGMAESVMKSGIYKIHTMDKDIWATPASFYAKKKR